MAQRNTEPAARHLQSELKEIRTSEGLPFRRLLDLQRLQAALERAGVKFRQRIFDPLTTISAFLSQAVASKDSSCEDAVSRVLAERVANNQPACSSDSSSYCKARARLPEQVITDLTRETGQEADRAALPTW